MKILKNKKRLLNRLTAMQKLIKLYKDVIMDKISKLLNLDKK
ncbi:hypothetical protein R4J17_03105 [Brachyspira intermedia]